MGWQRIYIQNRVTKKTSVEWWWRWRYPSRVLVRGGLRRDSFLADEIAFRGTKDPWPTDVSTAAFIVLRAPWKQNGIVRRDVNAFKKIFSQFFFFGFSTGKFFYFLTSSHIPERPRIYEDSRWKNKILDKQQKHHERLRHYTFKTWIKREIKLNEYYLMYKKYWCTIEVSCRIYYTT